MGEFILRENEIPRLYVRADHLGLIMLAQAARTSWDLVEEKGIRGLVEFPESRLYTLPVFDELLQADADTANISRESAGVFRVYYREAQVGWFFADSLWMRISLEPVPVFYCTRGHKNRDQDRGYCSKCPAPLKTVISSTWII